MLNQTFNSYYLEMGATEGFLKGEIKTLVDKLRDKEEYIKKLEEENRKLREELGVWLNANRILRMHDAKMESELKRYKDLLDAGEEFDYIGEESIENKVANEWEKAFSKCDKLVIKQLVINGMDFKTKD